VLAAEVKKKEKGRYNVFIHGGRIDTGLDAVEWIIKAVKSGAGEILLTSMDTDGTRKGYDIGITDIISKSVNVPVIASGGGGSLSHFYDVFTQTGADAALAASLFHYGELTIGQVKEYLKNKGICVR
jgi:cyclase